MLSRPGEITRRHDPDRFLCTLFAPAERRDALFTLYAFNHELARAREVVREPMMAMIRLQWWREVIEGTAKQHEVATPLRQVLDAGLLQPEDLLPLVDGREAELDTFETTRDWLAYVRATAGGLAVVAGHILVQKAKLAPEVATAMRELGAAYGVAGLLRNAVLAARQGRCLLPADALAASDLSVEGFIAQPDTPAGQAVLRQLAENGRAMLAAGSGARVPRQLVAAVLPAVLARRDLAHPGQVRPRGIGDRLAVFWAATTGQVA